MPCSQENWHVVSTSRRFRTLGEKRNACAALSNPDVDAYVVWDDDDIYLPHTLRAHADALSRAEWSRPSLFLHEYQDGRLEQRNTNGLFHGAWAFTREVFDRHYGYLAMNSGQDQELMRRFQSGGVSESDPCYQFPPYYIYRWGTTGSWHISAMGRNGYEALARDKLEGQDLYQISPKWSVDYLSRVPSKLQAMPELRRQPTAFYYSRNHQSRIKCRENCEACSSRITVRAGSVDCGLDPANEVQFSSGRCRLRKWPSLELERTGIIQYLIDQYGYSSYLEIGVRNGGNISRVRCDRKVGVDPKFDSHEADYTKHCLDSDSFFRWNQETFDLIFVDGLHEADQVARDIENALDCLSDGGSIVCHDLNPPSEQHQIMPRQSTEWCGDCWKAWVKLRMQRSELAMCVVDADFGCGILQRGEQKLLSVKDELSYKHLSRNRKDWLNLISVDNFFTKFANGRSLMAAR
jgi:hypothetical protein